MICMDDPRLSRARRRLADLEGRGTPLMRWLYVLPVVAFATLVAVFVVSLMGPLDPPDMTPRR